MSDTTASIQKAIGRRQKGFTLVELLVVISVIAVLIALLLPALRQARGVAQEISCQSTLRGLAIVLFQYQEEYQGFYPPAKAGGTIVVKGQNEPRVWSNYVLNGYMSGGVDALRCPADGDNPEYRASYGVAHFGGGIRRVAAGWEAHGLRHKMGDVRVYGVDANGTADFTDGIYSPDHKYLIAKPMAPYILEGLPRPEGTMLYAKTLRFRHRQTRMNYIGTHLGVYSADFGAVPDDRFALRWPNDGQQQWSRVVTNNREPDDWPSFYGGVQPVAGDLTFN